MKAIFFFLHFLLLIFFFSIICRLSFYVFSCHIGPERLGVAISERLTVYFLFMLFNWQRMNVKYYWVQADSFCDHLQNGSWHSYENTLSEETTGIFFLQQIGILITICWQQINWICSLSILECNLGLLKSIVAKIIWLRVVVANCEHIFQEQQTWECWVQHKGLLHQ